VRAEDGELPEPSGTITVRQRRSIGIALIARSVFTLYPRRTLLCFALFIGQAFLYNAFFFTYGDTLTTFLGVKQTGWYIAVFAASNFLGAFVTQSAIRHSRACPNDRGYLHRRRHLACHNRRDLGLADRCDADIVRRHHLLLRLGGARARPTSRSARSSRSRPERCASPSSMRSVPLLVALRGRCFSAP
jgi:hypothetical protein